MTIKEQYADTPVTSKLMEIYGWSYPHPMEAADLAADIERDLQLVMKAARCNMDKPHPTLERIASKYSLNADGDGRREETPPRQ